MIGTGSLIALLIMSLIGAAASGIEHGASSTQSDIFKKNMESYIRSNYPELSQAQIEALVNQYGDEDGGLWDITKWGDQSDWTGLQSELDKIISVYDELGEMPEAPTPDELLKIQQDAYNEIDSENRSLLDLYEQTLQDSTSQLRNSLYENTAMFNDYRNQMLTNEAIRQQAIAGSTRFELERQQRNAITRGASAAQRLVANINTQLGLQAQSAQQSLDTSNALAQNLLAHRQAQQNVRDSYFNNRNQYNNQVANVLSGQAERKYSYGQARKQGAVDDYNYAYDAYNTQLDNRFQGDSVGRNAYLDYTYGKRRQNNNYKI